jgi:hypothetical protein
MACRRWEEGWRVGGVVGSHSHPHCTCHGLFFYQSSLWCCDPRDTFLSLYRPQLCSNCPSKELSSLRLSIFFLLVFYFIFFIFFTKEFPPSLSFIPAHFIAFDSVSVYTTYSLHDHHSQPSNPSFRSFSTPSCIHSFPPTDRLGGA